jgi:hypothetical protein
MKKRKTVYIISAFVFLAVFFLGTLLRSMYGFRIRPDINTVLYIPSGATYSQVMDSLTRKG